MHPDGLMVLGRHTCHETYSESNQSQDMLWDKSGGEQRAAAAGGGGGSEQGGGQGQGGAAQREIQPPLAEGASHLLSMQALHIRSSCTGTGSDDTLV